jgi:DNA polymerase III subunit beta
MKEPAMKFKFNRQEMADALGAICSVTAVRTPKDILKCVHLEAHSDVLLMSATDLEVGLRCAVTQVEVAKPGDTLVVADTLNRIVRECTDEILTAEISGASLHLRGSGSHFQIVTQAPSDFPPVPNMDGEPSFSVEHGTLRQLIEWTLFAAARESTRYAINGVLWEVAGDGLTLAATDGRRLSVAKAKLAKAVKHEVPPAIVPTRALQLFGRLPAEDDAMVDVKVTSNQLRLKAGGALLSTSLVEGHFPKYQDVIPNDCDREVELNTDEFHGALRRAALLTNEESKGVRLSFSEGELTLSSRAPEQGEATISLPIRYKGESVDIGFNPVFLTDALKAAHGDEIVFAFKEANRPGVIRVGSEFIHVVMPVNLTSG